MSALRRLWTAIVGEEPGDPDAVTPRRADHAATLRRADRLINDYQRADEALRKMRDGGKATTGGAR